MYCILAFRVASERSSAFSTEYVSKLGSMNLGFSMFWETRPYLEGLLSFKHPFFYASTTRPLIFFSDVLRKSFWNWRESVAIWRRVSNSANIPTKVFQWTVRSLFMWFVNKNNLNRNQYLIAGFHSSSFYSNFWPWISYLRDHTTLVPCPKSPMNKSQKIMLQSVS